MNTANADQQSLWVVYGYEVDMFNEMRGACELGLGNTYPPHIANAIVESMLLHLRILVEILLSRGPDPDGDNIKLTDLLPGFKSPLIQELGDRYGNRGIERSPCWTLNKMLAHPSRLRSHTYTYDPVLKVMLPVLLPLLDEVGQARQLSSYPA
jgi:hypothetical protein